MSSFIMVKGEVKELFTTKNQATLEKSSTISWKCKVGGVEIEGVDGAPEFKIENGDNIIAIVKNENSTNKTYNYVLTNKEFEKPSMLSAFINSTTEFILTALFFVVSLAIIIWGVSMLLGSKAGLGALVLIVGVALGGVATMFGKKLYNQAKPDIMLANELKNLEMNS
ncbi:MAG: sterol desaturase family protein [Campylobacteraceae bacterium]|nr:sterol desaturase family protein [Campylobacteraceae bacterium]